MDASFVTTSKRLQRLCNFTRESITKIPNRSHLYMFFSVEVAEASERKCPQSSEAPPEPQLYALLAIYLKATKTLSKRYIYLLVGVWIIVPSNSIKYNKALPCQSEPGPALSSLARHCQ